MFTWLTVLHSRIRALVSAARQDSDFAQELQSHLTLLTEENVLRGMTPEEAGRQARLRLGTAQALQETHREQRSLLLVETTLRDIRYALRTLRKTPAFALTAIATLGIGIGANTAMFSVVRAVLLRPLPYDDPSRLIEISETNPLKGWTHNRAAPANFADWQKFNTVFTGVAAFDGTDDKGVSLFDVFLTGDGEPQRLKALSVTGNLFDVLGARPLLGRTFTNEETFEGKDRVAVIGYDLWQAAFAGDTRIVGRTISLSGRNYDVVGVMPADFFFPSRNVQIFIAAGVKPAIFTELRRPHYLGVIARLRPGVSLAQAREQMTAVAGRLEQMYPETNTRMGVRLEGLHASLAQSGRRSVLMLFSAVGFLFLIICANLANLQLGRASARTREITIRQALGASRGRLVRQLLTESLVLSILGGALGCVLALASRAALLRWAPEALPLYADLRLDRWVMVFNFAACIIAPLLFAALPAWSASRCESLSDRSQSGSPRARASREILVGCEVALSLMLVAGAGLLIRTLLQLENVDAGFKPDRVLAFNLTLPGVRYPTGTEALRLVGEIDGRLKAVPGVLAAGATSTLPLRGPWWTGDATVEGHPGGEYERELRHQAVTPGYFHTIGATLIRGRFLNEFDQTASAPVTLINQTLARRYFGADDPVGKRIKFGRPTDKVGWTTIVGMIADQKQDGMAAAIQPEVYQPMAQMPTDRLTFVIRSNAERDSLAAVARAQVRSVDKDLAITDLVTLDALVHNAVGDQRFRATLLTSFAAVALFLAALGVYGLLAYTVNQRTREIGVRLALGAEPSRLFRAIVGQGMRPVLVGAVAGLAGAYAATGLMKSLLFGIAPFDPPTYLVTLSILMLAAVAACAVPAARAVRVDPLIALRQD